MMGGDGEVGGAKPCGCGCEERGKKLAHDLWGQWVTRAYHVFVMVWRGGAVRGRATRRGVGTRQSTCGVGRCGAGRDRKSVV